MDPYQKLPKALAEAMVSLKAHEGYRAHPYTDTGNTWAVGYGHNLHTRGISRQQAEMLLADVLDELWWELHMKFPAFTQLTPARQAVLVEMAYQMGVTGLLGFKNTLMDIEHGDYERAAERMAESKWALQDTPERAKTLIARFRKG